MPAAIGITLALCAVFTITAWFYFIDIFTFISDTLKYFGRYISWSVNQLVFCTVVGLLPVFAFFSFALHGIQPLGLILVENLYTLIGLIFFLIAAYALAAIIPQPSSTFLPENVVYPPFQNYWNGALVFGSFFRLAVQLTRKGFSVLR